MKRILLFLFITVGLFTSCGDANIDIPSSSVPQQELQETVNDTYQIDTSLGEKAVASIIKYAKKTDMTSFIHIDDITIFEQRGIALSPQIVKITDDAIFVNLVVNNGKKEIFLDVECPVDYTYPVSQKDNITDISNLHICYPSATIVGDVLIITALDNLMFYDIGTLDKVSDDVSIGTITDEADSIFLCCTSYDDGYIAVYSAVTEEGLAVFDSLSNLKHKYTAGYKNMLVHRQNQSENSSIENNLAYSFYGQRKIRVSEDYIYFENENSFIADLSENKIYRVYPVLSHTVGNRTISVYSNTDVYAQQDRCYVVIEENNIITDAFCFDSRKISSEFGQDKERLDIASNASCTEITAVCDKTAMTLNIDTQNHKADISYNITADMIKNYETAVTSTDGIWSLKYNVSLYNPTRTVLYDNQTEKCMFICNGTAHNAGFNPDGTIFIHMSDDYILTDYKGNWLYSMAEELPYTDISKGQSIYLCDVYRKEDGSYLAVFFEDGYSITSYDYKLAVLDNNGSLVKVINTGKGVETVKSFYLSPDIEIVDYNTVKLIGGDREYIANYFEILVELSTDYCEIT